jgi:hypothetical protein
MCVPKRNCQVAKPPIRINDILSQMFLLMAVWAMEKFSLTEIPIIYPIENFLLLNALRAIWTCYDHIVTFPRKKYLAFPIFQFEAMKH